jgi:hypothetical protein
MVALAAAEPALPEVVGVKGDSDKDEDGEDEEVFHGCKQDGTSTPPGSKQLVECVYPQR